MKLTTARKYTVKLKQRKDEPAKSPLEVSAGSLQINHRGDLVFNQGTACTSRVVATFTAGSWLSCVECPLSSPAFEEPRA